MSGILRLAIPLLLAAPSCLTSADAPKPTCDQHTRGKLWPEKTARGDATPVEICAPRGWHYRWQQLTVDVSQLKAAAAKKSVAAAWPVLAAAAAASSEAVSSPRR